MRLANDDVDARIIELLLEGLPNKSIATRLGIAEGTVKARLHRMYKRAGVGSKVQLVIKLLRGPDHG